MQLLTLNEYFFIFVKIGQEIHCRDGQSYIDGCYHCSCSEDEKKMRKYCKFVATSICAPYIRHKPRDPSVPVEIKKSFPKKYSGMILLLAKQGN